jgi:hypothetical protein
LEVDNRDDDAHHTKSKISLQSNGTKEDEELQNVIDNKPRSFTDLDEEGKPVVFVRK